MCSPVPGRAGRCGESTRGVAAMHAEGRPKGSPWRRSRGGWGGAARGGRRGWPSPSGSGVAAARTGPDRVGSRARRSGAAARAALARGRWPISGGALAARAGRGTGLRLRVPASASGGGIPPGTFAASGGALPIGASGAFGGSGVEVSRRRRRVPRGECRSRSRPPCTTAAPPGARAVRAARPRTGRSAPPGCRVDPDSKR